MEKIIYPKTSRFWFTWIAMTVIYLSGNVLISYIEDIIFLEKIVFFFGLFVPYGIWNTIFSIGNILGIFSFLIFLGIIVSADGWASYLKIKAGVSKIIFNLALLFIITLITDLILHGAWYSWYLLIGKHICC